ncbi:MBL fold metallo-hydrolase [Spiribacter vilamensis]|uniref:Glyoxylase-like metal-dependent hydrolase (Beta-lactamase superfamily II) n=1 Tax=Spiribacter vilamensis TaxID=531306 RepID=A0A4Q8D061_9GAMM|nr:MBL fold metallo-hydrolase [Spiribacter vilamensis]RZU98696.1 glyoxylase-like metal-dependent hydrolase (beta-lactamase superfamily II) [Spiribacter vilamensis]TVO62278.1 MBL fold metallo-hydrolase [Spiribacter vilamensis]
MKPIVRSVFHPPSHTFSYVVWDPVSRRAAIIDPALDFDPQSGRSGTETAQQLVEIVRAEGLTVDWLLETHAHADHITAMPFLQGVFNAPTAIGERITEVQTRFAWLFNLGDDFRVDGSQFDQRFADGQTFTIGELPVQVFHTPGHTSDHITYVIGDAVFVGDTLFMPDAGTARCDFPAGSARELYRSIHRLFDALPDSHRLFVLHDYGTDERGPECLTTIGEQRAGNIHLGNGVSEDDYVAMREARDATLPMPVLILPAVQVNIRAGHFPPAEANGLRYLKIPVDEFGAHWSPPSA